MTDHPRDGDPSVSSDGSTIVFIREGDLYVMKADGSEMRQLTSGPDDDSEPKIAPNGRYVLFNRRYWEAPTPPGGEKSPPHYSGDLYTISFAGGSEHLLTRGPGQEREASFSPDGKAIVFIRSRAMPSRFDVFSVRPSGGRATPLTDTWQDESHPRYFAHGILFDRRRKVREGAVMIYAMRRDGSDIRLLVHRKGGAQVSAVSPNGRLLVFSMRAHGLWMKRLVSPTRRSPRAHRLTGAPGERLVFSPDSRRIAGIFGFPGGFFSLSSIDMRTGRIRGEGEVFEPEAPGPVQTSITSSLA